MGRKPTGKVLIAYNGRIEQVKIDVFGGTYETNKLAYELLTKEYNKRQRQIAKINVNL